MLFTTFQSQSEQRKEDGSSFIELQFCKLPHTTQASHIVSVKKINHWQNDSLYICDEQTFYQKYHLIFDGGLYNNLNSGTLDLHGINYYAPPLTDSIIEKLHQYQPTDYEVLIEWLNKSKKYNGFYILGI